MSKNYVNATLHKPKITHGRIYRGQIPGTICFVPEDCFTKENNTFQAQAYEKSKWAQTNLRLNPAAIGSQLLPNIQSKTPPNNEQITFFLSLLNNI